MCKYTREQIAGAVDLAALKPEHTSRDTLLVCHKAARYNCASVCVKPSFVTLAAKWLEGTDVGVGTVINFPHGNSVPEVNALEAYTAVGDGATELDVVMDIGAALTSNWKKVEAGLQAVVNVGYEWNVIVKVILETCYLPDPVLRLACELCANIGADYVKTSTGFGKHGATPKAIHLMREFTKGKCQLKASGGIKTYEDARKYLDLGCTRLGSSKIEELFPYEEL